MTSLRALIVFQHSLHDPARYNPLSCLFWDIWDNWRSLAAIVRPVQEVGAQCRMAARSRPPSSWVLVLFLICFLFPCVCYKLQVEFKKNKKCTFMCQISKYGHHFSFWLTSSNCKQSLSLLSAVHSYRETTGDQCKHSERFLNVLAEKLTLYSQSTALSSRYRHHKSENTDNSVSISDSVTIPLWESCPCSVCLDSERQH